MLKLTVVAEQNNTVSIENYGSGIVGRTAEKIEVHVNLVCEGKVVCKDHITLGEVLCNIFGSLISVTCGMDGENNHVILIFGRHLIEVGKLLLSL